MQTTHNMLQHPFITKYADSADKIISRFISFVKQEIEREYRLQQEAITRETTDVTEVTEKIKEAIVDTPMEQQPEQETNEQKVEESKLQQGVAVTNSENIPSLNSLSSLQPPNTVRHEKTKKLLKSITRLFSEVEDLLGGIQQQTAHLLCGHPCPISSVIIIARVAQIMSKVCTSTYLSILDR